MRLKVNATGSKGNAYSIQARNGKVLLLECGISERKMLNGVALSLIDGLFVSHNHRDHNVACPKFDYMSDKFVAYEIPTYTSDDMEENKLIDLGTFKIIPIELEHNVKCFGCLILCDNLKILFATDTSIIPLVENVKIDYFLVECNYQKELLLQRIDELLNDNERSYEITRLKSVLHNHCSLETLVEYFKMLGYRPKGIYTLHLSNSGLGDKEDIESTLIAYSDKVKVLEKGDRIELC